MQEKKFTKALNGVDELEQTLDQKIESAKLKIRGIQEQKERLIATIRNQRGQQATNAQKEQLRDIVEKERLENQWLNQLRVEYTSTATLKNSVRSTWLAVSQRVKTKDALGNLGNSVSLNPKKLMKAVDAETDQRDALQDVSTDVSEALQDSMAAVTGDVDNEVDSILQDIQNDVELAAIMEAPSIPSVAQKVRGGVNYVRVPSPSSSSRRPPPPSDSSDAISLELSGSPTSDSKTKEVLSVSKPQNQLSLMHDLV
jgi:hypothetical protein